MKNIRYNLGYFLKETQAILRLNRTSNIFSLVSTGLILFILAMVIAGWWVSSRVIASIQGEAEINVYYQPGIGDDGAGQIISRMQEISGVRSVRLVEAAEAYSRMEKILGQDARILGYFEANPFSSFIEVKINLAEIDAVLKNVEQIDGVAQIRDNREVLDRLRQLAEFLGYIGFLVMAAVAVTTLVIISHLTRLGIQQSWEQINTLRLLGAPEYFIAIPFLLEGLLLTLGGGVVAAGLSVLMLRVMYGQMAGPLPFLPLPPLAGLTYGLSLLIVGLGAVLGLSGSYFGLLSARNN